MKFFIYIFSFFILLSTVKPCQDETDYTTISYEQQDDIHNCENHQDTCSSFCYCLCCGIVLSNIKLDTAIYSKKLPKYKTTFTHFYENLYFKEFIDTITYPPIV